VTNGSEWSDVVLGSAFFLVRFRPDRFIVGQTSGCQSRQLLTCPELEKQTVDHSEQ
jgi:hypothetical protein